jgi:hypothetical protein
MGLPPMVQYQTWPIVLALSPLGIPGGKNDRIIRWQQPNSVHALAVVLDDKLAVTIGVHWPASSIGRIQIAYRC